MSDAALRGPIVVPLRRFAFLWDLDIIDSIDEITKAVQNKKPLHLVPSDFNFLAYNPNEVLIICIQTGIGREHHILVSDSRVSGVFKAWLERGTWLAGPTGRSYMGS